MKSRGGNFRAPAEPQRARRRRGNFTTFAWPAVAMVLMSGCTTLDKLFPTSSAPDATTTEVESIDAGAPHAVSGNDPTLALIEVNVDASPSSTTKKLVPPDNVWDVVRSSMRLEFDSNARIENQIAWYQKHNRTIERVTENARTYLHYVVQQAEHRQLPAELTLLPVIESGYRPFARSPSGASGLWQFIPGTGRRFGLAQNWWYDGRRDVVASTQAAFEYLERLNRQFDGDWLLAIAAYNAGEGTVLAAMKHNRKRGKPVDYWSLELPRETMTYVPRLLALSRIVADPVHFGLEVPAVANEPVFQVVELQQQIDLARVAELAAISMDEVYRLNPGFNRWATAPEGPHRVLVPSARADEFVAGLSKMPPERYISWQRHVVVAGDTLSGLAQRYDTTVATLRRINKLNGNLIRAGRSLLVPTASLPADSYTLSADARGVVPVTPGSGTRLAYVVKPGDSLWAIAKRHGTSVKQLTRWNGLSRHTTLQPGQQLTLWRTSDASSNHTSAVANNAVADTPSLRYTVARGDSLWQISRRFGVTVVALRRWNNLQRGALLQPGQTLNVHPEDPAQIKL